MADLADHRGIEECAQKHAGEIGRAEQADLDLALMMRLCRQGHDGVEHTLSHDDERHRQQERGDRAIIRLHG